MPSLVARLTLILLLTSSVSFADISTTDLPERPTATIASALTKAKKEIKAVFVILYDDKETIPTTLNMFFDSPAVKKSFKDHFVICVRARRRPDAVPFDKADHAWNRARFVVLTPDGEQIYEGRFLRNDEAGMIETQAAVQKWLAVKPGFQPLPTGSSQKSGLR